MPVGLSPTVVLQHAASATTSATPAVLASAVSAIVENQNGKPGLVFPIIIVLIGVVMVSKAANMSEESRKFVANVVTVAVFLASSLSIDILISSSRHQGLDPSGAMHFAYDPACMVVLVDCVRLLASISLLFTFRQDSSSYLSLSTCPMPSDSDTEITLRSVIVWTSIPALVFFANNLLIYVAIERNCISDFGVFRDTVVPWTALLWWITFRASLGTRRILALGLLFLGLCLNQFQKFIHFRITAPIMIVCIMAFTSALGSVVNEVVLKRFGVLDLNLQNIVMYSWCVVLGIAYIACMKPEKLTGLDAFTEGIQTEATAIILLQAFAGISASRMLKYTSSVSKSIAASLRGPSLVFLAPVLGLPSRTDLYAFSSAAIVAAAACWYILQGPIQVTKGSTSEWNADEDCREIELGQLGAKAQEGKRISEL